MREQLIFTEGAFIDSDKPIEETWCGLGKNPVLPAQVWVDYPPKDKYLNPEGTMAWIRTGAIIYGMPMYRLTKQEI